MKFGLFTVFDNYQSDLGRTPGPFLQEVTDQILLADELGFDAAWVAEHHFHEYGILASPQLFLAALARQTRRIRLGVSVATLPFHDPVRVAEDYALLDLLSDGRLNLGLGSGYLPHEFNGFGLQADSKRTLFNEKWEIIQKLWRGDTFTHHSNHHHYGPIQLEILPQQQPIPTWIAALRPEAIDYVGQMGYPVMGVAYVSTQSIAELKLLLARYKASALKAGHNSSRYELPIALHVHVAETREQAHAQIEEPLNRYLRTRLYGQGVTFHDLLHREQVLVGSPEDVVTQIKKYRVAGVTHLMALMNFGGLPHEQVKQSMELFAREVIPAL